MDFDHTLSQRALSAAPSAPLPTSLPMVVPALALHLRMLDLSMSAMKKGSCILLRKPASTQDGPVLVDETKVDANQAIISQQRNVMAPAR